MDRPLWTPGERAASTAMAALADEAWHRGLIERPDYADLHRWSVEDLAGFWSLMWDRCGVVGEKGDVAFAPAEDMWRAQFFPRACLNYARNLLRHDDDLPALLFAREDGERRQFTRRELRALVSRVEQALRAAGVGPGDRVAAWLPNVPEACALMLAAAAIGATFTSCSPDFGAAGAVDRFGQIAPKVLVAVDGYLYGGRRVDCTARLAALRQQLPATALAVVVEHLGDAPAVEGAPTWDDWLAPHLPGPIGFEELPFDHPLAVLYSSGTTGLPKCIVHRAGGLLLKHLVEHRFHCDIGSGDRVFWFTTTGWMMWNWLASALASGATLVLYDGSPAHPRPDSLWALAEETGATVFGTSARFLDACDKGGLSPGSTYDLSALRLVGSTGSALSARSFDYVYEHVKADVHLASISGGTDLCGALVGADPTGPVWRGEIQAPVLGQAIAVLGDDGEPLGPGEPGELVCATPFPSLPLGLWGDDDRASGMRATWFDRFPGAWHQGDYAHWTEHGGLVISGRSDATLNAGGVRIGTAEIYRQLDDVPEVAEAVAIGQAWDGDTRVVLLVVLAPGAELTPALEQRIRDRIRAGASPRHVPARIAAVADLPRTRTNKLAELTVRDAVAGREVRNVGALANPEALDLVRDLPELAT